ncbi:MAG TPA: RCC1 domain-containing protein [Polyangia bacterium]
MKLKGWIGVALAPLAAIQAGCGEDESVCRGGYALSILGDTVGVLKADGSLWAWATQHQGSDRPQRETTDANATGFANGQMCLRLRNGDVSCPLLPFSQQTFPAHAREVAIWTENGVEGRACAVLADGTLTCAPPTDFLIMRDPSGPPFTTIRDGVRNASIGSDHYCAMTNDGELACAPWETSSAGREQSWNGAGATLSGIVEVATASDMFWSTSVARDAGGDVWWLQVVVGTDNPVVTIDRVLGIDGPVVQLAAGNRSFCALRDDGAVFCWENDDYVLPYHAVPYVPQRIVMPQAATAIAVGPGKSGVSFGCALLEDTTVWCWGAGFGLDGRSQYVASCG